MVVHGNTMYIAGTRTAPEWVLDVGLPFGGVKLQPRYHAASTMMGPHVEHVVGHSMGGTVAQQLTRDHERLTGVSYGAPPTLFPPSKRFVRRRDLFDPVSLLDLGATTHNVWKPHTYDY